jgi:hippurate hydrolase
MLLAAAKHIAANGQFSGTLNLIFQPAEEGLGGAKKMMEDGLFERFPVDAIYGAHNIPGLPTGHIATRVGGIMASEDNFVIRIQGRGGHAARPHMAIDALVVAAEIILALQTVVARSVDPADAAVLSCTQIHSDGIRRWAISAQLRSKNERR